MNRCAAVTGKLEVRLMGCQDLLEDVSIMVSLLFMYLIINIQL